MSMRTSLVTLLVCFAVLVRSAGVRGEVVTNWNQIASATLVADTSLQNPGMASRTMAMMNLAIHDSFAMTRADGQSFYRYSHLAASPGASSSAAAAVAAHAVLRSIYPDQSASLDAARTSSLAGIAEGAAKSAGIGLGQAIGQSIVQRRAADGYNASTQYVPSGEIGRWAPDPLNDTQQAWGPEWGSVQTFRIPSVSSFLPAAPPPLTSQQYADAFNEVKSLGAVDSTTRTQEQTDIGNFWAYDRIGMGTPMRLYNQALRNIATAQGNTPEQNAELFAKASVAMADAGIVAWNSKFEHDLWRPVTGIRQADLDGNPLTEADPDWTPLGAPEVGGPNFTPPFPTYLSGHATFGGALFATIENFYGTDDIEFSLASDELPDQLRTFAKLSDAMAENGRSRVYLGIHWNFDDTVAQQTGIEVANFITTGPFVTAVPEPGTITLLAAAATCAIARRGRSIAHRRRS